MITELERLYFKYSDYIIIDDMLIDQLSKNLTTKDRFYANDVQKCANEQCENYLDEFIWGNGEEIFYVTTIDRFFLLELTCEHCNKISMMIKSVNTSIKKDLELFIKEKSIVQRYESFIVDLKKMDLDDGGFVNKLIQENHMDITLNEFHIKHEDDIADVNLCVQIYPFLDGEIITDKNIFLKKMYEKYKYTF